jgi:alpha-N-arabinofuranosidase
MFSEYLGDYTLKSDLNGGGPRFFYSITENTEKKLLYLKLVNADSTPQSVEIDLPGAKLETTAKLVSLSAPDTQATNTIEDLDRLVPVNSTLSDVSSRFHHKMPGYSIQVIEFHEQ